MTDESQIDDGKQLLRQLAEITRELPDEQIHALFGNGALDGFMNAILNPTTAGEYPSIAEFFAANKNRSATIAGIRAGITRACAIKGTKEGTTGYVSPTEMQWFDDAVMFLEGKGPFEGLICKYQNGHMSYAVAARDAEVGDELGPDAFLFVDIDDTKNRFKNEQPPSPHELELPIRELQSLLDANDSDEAKYQELLASHPWVLGLQYQSIQRHEQLDDKNIPDFTGVRVSDKYRDIFEIKPPSMAVFRADGEFTAPFNAAWNQAERYLNFARQETDYLRRKGFRFDSPKCILICGYDLSADQIAKLRIKERMNPSLQLLTFNDLIAFMNSTANFIKKVAV